MREILEMNDLKALLEDTSSSLKAHNVNVDETGDYVKLLTESETYMPHEVKQTSGNLFDTYVNSLAQGLNEDSVPMFKKLAKNIALDITSNLNESMNTSVSFTSPQAKLALPLFRFMWPRLIMKDVVTTTTMDSPELVKYFFRPYIKRKDNSVVQLPETTAPLGLGEDIGTYDTPATVAVPGHHTVLTTLGYSNEYHFDRNVIILSWKGIDSAGADVTGELGGVVVDEEGKFNFSVIIDEGTPDEVRDVVTGVVDFDSGDIHISSTRDRETTSRVTEIGYVATALSTEENLAARVGFKEQKIHMNATDLQLQAEWSVQFEQDMKRRMGIDVQAEFISVFGNQSQLSINLMLMRDIMYHVQKSNPSNVHTFNTSPTRSSFAHTIKDWAPELLYLIEKCSANIFNATSLTPATHILANPCDLVWLNMLDSYSMKGSADKGGDFGSYSNAGSLSNGMKVLCSPFIPKGYMILAAKPSQENFANYIFAPYIPMSVYPYPLGNKPSMTFLSRFCNKMLRPEGFGIIRLVD